MDLHSATERLIARALTFEERRRLLRRGMLAEASPSAHDRSHRLKRWTLWMTRDSAEPTGWQKFLSAHGVTEDELLSMAEARFAKPVRQRWTRTLEELLLHLSRGDSRPRERLLLAENLALPAVLYAWRRLCRSRDHHLATKLHPTVAAALRAMLRRRLASGAERIVAEALWLATQDDLRFGVFQPQRPAVEASCDGLHANDLNRQTLCLLHRYPALARLWANQIDHWTDFTKDFLLAAEDFIGSAQASTHEADRAVRQIRFGLSDPHDGGRTVLETRLANGERWFYKPRSGKHEKGWFGLLRWLNDEGFCAPFQIVEVLTGKSSCWMAAVPQRSCRTRAEVARAYFRAGALLCLVDLLSGVDIHAQNLVANGSQPVIVDPETFFHPVPPKRIAGRQPLLSVLRTGMLPIATAQTPDQNDVSTLGRCAAGPHSVRLRGLLVPATQYISSIVQGFFAMHGFLRQTPERANRFNQFVQELKTLRWRRILRPTAHYYSILESSQSPLLLSDGMDRSLYLHAACGLGQVPHAQRCAEANCLEQGDIPQFYKQAGDSLPRQHANLTKITAAIRAAFDGTAN